MRLHESLSEGVIAKIWGREKRPCATSRDSTLSTMGKPARATSAISLISLSFHVLLSCASFFHLHFVYIEEFLELCIE